MAVDRFPFQREAVDHALAKVHQLDPDTAAAGYGLILNVGSNEDPAHLKQRDPQRVINCDLFDYDTVIGRPNTVDRLFDAAKDRWPFLDGQADLVVLGDILEHLTPDEIRATLAEARRVSRGLCITVPEDHRPEVTNERADTYPRGAVHRTVVTRDLLQTALQATGWTVTRWETVEYDDGTFWGMRTMGHHVLAE